MDEDISLLLERFLSSQKNGQNVYFDVDDIISLIDYFLDKDDTANLKTAIELGYELHPNDINFKIALCKSLVAMEDYKFALKMIEGLGIKNNKDLILMRLECLCELGRYKEAHYLIDKMKEEKSDYLEDALVQTACILNNTEGRKSDACKFIKEGLSIFPDSFYLRLELCYNYELQGKTHESLILCQTLINENPYSAEAWYTQGRILSSCADFEKAVDMFDFALTCLEEDEDDLETEIKMMKAYCLYKNESYEKAIELYNEIIEEDDLMCSEAEPFIAECYMKLDEYEKAYQVLHKTIRRKDLDDEVAVFGNYIYCCIETDRTSEAVKTLSDALKRFPHSIFEYLSTLNIIKDQLSETYTGKEKIIHLSDLTKNYISDGTHNN